MPTQQGPPALPMTPDGWPDAKLAHGRKMEGNQDFLVPATKACETNVEFSGKPVRGVNNLLMRYLTMPVVKPDAYFMLLGHDY